MDEPSTDLLKSLDSEIVASKSKQKFIFIIIELQGDWIDGLIVGFDMIYNKIGKVPKQTLLIFEIIRQ